MTSPIGIGGVCTISLTAVFLLLAADKAGELRKDRYVWAPPSKAAPAPPAEIAPRLPQHNDTVEDLPDGRGRETTFYTCTACHGVALIKAQGLTRDLWDSTFDLMLEKHRMAPVKPEERAEILDYLSEQFPPRRRGRGADNPFLR
ncbi:MAG: hypothetical protein KIT25_04865 [Enhydrobacter sp.]|nr:MAG: hypothetical protein KIT25_04865 [Enhydrobacter sp.]